MSGRSIPIALQAHLKQPSTTTCRLWKVSSYGAAPLGLCSLDHDVVYDGLTYRAHRGYTPYDIQTDANLSVDNSEMEVLVATYEVDGFTLDAIERGVYDDATFVEYMVNYRNVADGAMILSSGAVGKIRQVDGLVCFPEVRSLTQTLKQKSIIRKGTNGCPVVEFGDAECKFPVATLWTDRTIIAVGIETDRVFTVDGPVLSDNAWRPGLWNFYDGANAGRSYEIESNAGNVITLAIPTEKVIAADDTGRGRPDCTRAADGANGCKSYGNLLNHRGQFKRPVSESIGLMGPGAGSPSGVTDVQSDAQ